MKWKSYKVSCVNVLFVNSQYRSTYFFAWPSMSWDQAIVFARDFSQTGNFLVAPTEIRDTNILLYSSMVLPFDLHSRWVHPKYTWSKNVVDSRHSQFGTLSYLSSNKFKGRFFFFLHCNLTSVWPCKFHSTGTTWSSMLDLDFGHLCRSRRIPISGHSDLGSFHHAEASSILIWIKSWYCIDCLSCTIRRSRNNVHHFFHPCSVVHEYGGRDHDAPVVTAEKVVFAWQKKASSLTVSSRMLLKRGDNGTSTLQKVYFTPTGDTFQNAYLEECQWVDDGPKRDPEA